MEIYVEMNIQVLKKKGSGTKWVEEGEYLLREANLWRNPIYDSLPRTLSPTCEGIWGSKSFHLAH